MVGDFDWKEKAWLVLWEAKLIIQLPIGVFFFYPSALFIHFNINIRGKPNTCTQIFKLMS